jgi:hypothetical protein
MPYPRLVVLGALAWFVAAGCGNAARSTGDPNVNQPPPEQEDAGSNNNNNNNPPPDAAPVLGSNGKQCGDDSECKSQHCSDGVCCDSDCTGACRSCKLSGNVGTCNMVGAGEDPENECGKDPANTCKRTGFCDGNGACQMYDNTTECAAATCTAGMQYSNKLCDGSGKCGDATSQACTQGCMITGNTSVCPLPCSATNPCMPGLACDVSGTCKPKKAQGQACASGDECTSTFCVDGFCCGSACVGTCQACNLPGSLGLCTPVPMGQDPNAECPRDTNAPCGKVGGCNGSGSCQLAPQGTLCGTNGTICSGVTQSMRACDGNGMCVTSNSMSCAPYRCTNGQCGVSCFTSNDCAPGTTCTNGACDMGTVVTGDEILHWAFDDTSNTVATDSSPNFHNGAYIGNGGNRPTSSTNVPNIGTTNTRSRLFDNAQREAVQLAAFPNDLRPTNNMTVALWFRAGNGDLDTNGADLLSGGDSYVLRLRTGSLEFGKRADNGNGGTAYVTCRANVNGLLDNQWHHVAGVTTQNGMVLYYDGSEICSNTQGGDIVYNRGNDLFVGRNGFNDANWDFGGYADDVRIFGRDLSADEVRGLAGSTPGSADIVLQWKFDETSTTSTVANDSSGNNYDGTYLGNNGNLPGPSTDVPSMTQVDPRSRDFNRANREAVRRTNMPAAMKPRNDLTLSLWFKADQNGLDTSGADLISGGDNYVLRLRTNQIEFSKRTNNGAQNLWVQCTANAPTILSNQWHHLAGVTTPDGMVVYLDGQEACNVPEGGDIVYDQGNDLYVGRHGNGQTNWDFQGKIDDVRIYGRGLDAQEVADLAGGTRPAEMVLNWKFDETSTTNTTAQDSSGSGANGVYIGTTGFPAPSTQVPGNLTGTSIRSRTFTRANRQAVRLANMPNFLKPNNELTVSAWYKSGALGAGMQGEEVVSAGNNYLLRVRNGQIDFSKRVAGAFAACVGTFANSNDNQWHHIAGTSSATTGMRLFVDGTELMPCNTRTEDIVYDQGTDFLVGRHGTTQTTWDFQGNIDDVRVYTRALEDTEISAIYQGQQ